MRAGNCFGGGDWTKDRIVKDCLETPLHQIKLYFEKTRGNTTMATCIRAITWLFIISPKLCSKQSEKFKDHGISVLIPDRTQK